MKKSEAYVEHRPSVRFNRIRQNALNDFNKFVSEGKIILKKNELCYCGSKNFEKLSSIDRYGLSFPTRICTECGLISQSHSISDDTIDYFYDRVYWPLTKGTNQTNTYFTYDENSEFIKFLSPSIPKNKSRLKVYEIGAGTASKLLSLEKYFQNNQISFDLYACDYSSEVIKFLQEKNIHCTHGGADSLIPIGKADIIILSHVFEHFTNIEENLNIISQLAGNETLIYVEVPGVKNLSNNLHYNYDYQDFSVVAHIHNFTLTTLSNIFLTKQLYLLDGNEFIRSIFTKKNIKKINKKENDYEKTIKSLLDLRAKYEKRVNSIKYILINNIKNTLFFLISLIK